MTIKREYPSAPVVAVAALILDKGRLLLIRRKNEPSKGLWSAPGGVVELAEKVEDAVKREVNEETGLRIEVERILTVLNHIIKDKEDHVRFHYVIIYFLVRALEGKPVASTDAEDVRWIRIDEIKNLPASEAFKGLIEDAKRRGWLNK
jgi:8-oxo-dGTP diphosphatase